MYMPACLSAFVSPHARQPETTIIVDYQTFSGQLAYVFDLISLLEHSHIVC